MTNYEDKTLDTNIPDQDEGIDFENYNLEEVIAKYEGARPMAYKVLIRLYKPVLKKHLGKSGLLLASTQYLEKTDQDNQFTNFVGLVVKMSDGAFKEEKFDLTGRCKVGDWVMFDRAYAKSYVYNGLVTMIIDDDRIIQVIDDPRMISRISIN